MGKLSGEVAIVTGGAAGLGEGIVKKFTEEGSSVVILDFNISPLEGKAVRENVKVVQGDVTNPDSWKKALDTAINAFGKVTIVVNNAGVVTKNALSHEADLKDLDKVFSVNVKGLFTSVQALVPYFKEKKVPATFVNVTSVSAFRPRPGLAFYAASKSAADTANKCLALEYASDGIRFVGVAPVIASTPMMYAAVPGLDESETSAAKLAASIPIGRVATPSDIANMAAHLACSESSMVTGITVPIDGGRCV